MREKNERYPVSAKIISGKGRGNNENRDRERQLKIKIKVSKAHQV